MLASGPFKLNSRVIPSSFIPGLSYYYTSPPSTSSPSSRSPPLSLLLGWYASTPKQVSKYAQIYNGLGFNTISLTLPHEAVFGNQESTRKLRDAVAVELESIVNDRTIVPPSSPIVMQVFSNGGAFGLLHLTPSLTPSIFHSLKGVVYDSAPCYLHAVAGARALSYGITNRQGGRKMVEFALSPLFYIAGAFRTLVTGVDMREVRMDEERSDELRTLALGTKTVRARTSVQGAPLPQSSQ